MSEHARLATEILSFESFRAEIVRIIEAEGGNPRHLTDLHQRVSAALRALRRAQRQLEAGQYAQAYPTLRRLADGAETDVEEVVVDTHTVDPQHHLHPRVFQQSRLRRQRQR